MKSNLASGFLALAAAYILAPALLFAIIGPRYASEYSNFAAPLPDAVQWALHVYPLTFLFSFGITPVYLLSRLKPENTRLRARLVTLTIIIMLVETIWTFSVWYPLWLLMHKLSAIA